MAAGKGRHSLFFARRGCRVFAVEREWEFAADLRYHGIDCVEGDVEKWTLLPQRFDVVVNTFFLNRPLLRQYSATLRPNGLIFVRTFTTAHMDVLGQVRPRREFLLEPEELRQTFGHLAIVYYAETLDERRAMATIVAKKQAVMTE